MRRLSMVLAAGAVFLAAPAAGVLAPVSATASADQAVVSATIYGGRQAGITSQTVTAGPLRNCPTYSGASPFLLRPGNASYQPASGSSWSLDTIVECGLQIPAVSLTDVAVQSLQHGFETPLSPPDLTDASRYQDPAAPGALPLISLDGGQNQVTYARPERSPSDANATDKVVATGPVTIAVYENAPPLQVRALNRRLSVSPTALRVQLAATVTGAAGQALAPPALSWSWSFGDGTGSGQPAPTHAFPLGRWFVTVVVTDRANGTGGTATIPVSVDTHALAGSTDRAGTGNHRRGSSLSGAVKSAGSTRAHGRTRPQTRHHSSAGPSPTSAGGQGPATGATTTPPATTTPAAATTTPGASTAPATTSAPAMTSAPAPAAHARRLTAAHRPRASHGRRVPRPTRARSVGAGRIVRGLLIADVTPVAPAASRLTQATPGAASATAIVRAATHAPVRVGGLIAAALILALLGLGAGREHRGRRRARELRPGP